MPDIFDEVEEDLRRDRAMRLWQRHGWLLLVAVGLLIAGTGGWQAWSWHQRRTAEAATATLLAALREAGGSDTTATTAALDQLARDGTAGPRTLARLVEAARLASAGQAEQALPLWQAIAADSGTEALYRDLAVLLAGMHTLDTADPAQLAARLAPIALPANPWQHLARELLALLADRRGDREAAIAGFRALATDAEAPAGVRQRAEAMLTVLGAGGGQG